MKDFPTLTALLTALHAEGFREFSLGSIERLGLDWAVRAYPETGGQRELSVCHPAEGWIHLGYASRGAPR